jgi:tRNA threonylcarbamoyladenosine biosynthesis protein TsaB
MGGDDRTAKLLRVSARLLAFDTSTEALSVALHCDAGSFEWNGPGGAAASAQLLPLIRNLLREAGVPLAQLQAIAFGSGPGAFTGLRIACAVAQGLAFGAALPVLPLDSLMIVAEGVRVEHADAPAEVDVVMDARMGEVYAGRYAWTGTLWQVSVAPALRSLDGLHAAWDVQPPRCVAGTALPAFGERLHSADALRIGGDIDRAAALLRLAQQRWVEEGGVDAAAALPLYLRDKVALTVAERDALRRAAVKA